MPGQNKFCEQEQIREKYKQRKQKGRNGANALQIVQNNQRMEKKVFLYIVRFHFRENCTQIL